MENRLVVVFVRGRRTAWSADPAWHPESPAFGPEYETARAAGLAGRTREPAHRVVRDVLARGARGCLVKTGTRVAWVERRGHTIRTAWSDAPGEWWPVDTTGSVSYERVQAQGLAGVVYGAAPMVRVLSEGHRAHDAPIQRAG